MNREMWGWGHPQLNPGAAGMPKWIRNTVSAPADYIEYERRRITIQLLQKLRKAERLCYLSSPGSFFRPIAMIAPKSTKRNIVDTARTVFIRSVLIFVFVCIQNVKERGMFPENKKCPTAGILFQDPDSRDPRLCFLSAAGQVRPGPAVPERELHRKSDTISFLY